MAYTISGRKSGTVRFLPDNGTVQKESISMSSSVTTNPIEDGSDINDHVIKSPKKFSVNGVLIGGQSGRQILESMRDRRDILTYSGRMRINNLVITSLSFDYSSDNATGSSFKASFQQVQISSSAVVAVSAEQTMSQQDADATTSYSHAQTATTSSDGLKTTAIDMISSSAYGQYVESYNNKPASSTGPLERQTASYSGLR